jgi:hypothetical protein
MSDSELQDASDFAAAAGKYEPKSNDRSPTHATALIGKTPDEADDEIVPGRVVQYSLYRDGYRSTTATIQTLPPSCYDINADSNGVYVIPMPSPTGLLLELPEMRSEDVIKIVENFWNSEKDYKEGNEFVIGGAAYKSGLMIYGPPGSGKSCTIKLLSRKLVERGGTVFFADINPSTVMAFLEDFSKIEKNRKSIVILEDIDSLIENYGESGYLAMLDSAKTIDNVLFIATTNYPDKLDPRIYNRPGRFSHVIKIGYPSAKARRAFLEAMLKDWRDIDVIVDRTANFTIDHITSLISAVYREKKELLPEIERLKTLFKVPKSDNDRPSMGINADEF